MAKTWTVRPPAPETVALARELGLAPLAARVLAARGLADVDEARAFLAPTLDMLHDPGVDPALVAAAERLMRAARDGEPIVIYGDYDVDGITGAAILWQALRLADANARVYIPHRVEEGYGLNADAVDQLADEGIRLLVTVDCGVTSAAEVARARERGMDVLVTDHHEPDPGRLPDATVLVDPKLPDSAYPFRELSGAGLALKLAWALGRQMSPAARVSDEFREFLLAATGLAALGTIADVVPLVGENHVLAHFGLRALAGSRNPGIRALLEVSGLAGKALEAGHVGFMLGPRLNAAGRMGSALEAVELLTTAGPDAAMAIAEGLDRENRRRRKVEKEILEQAEEVLGTTADPDHDRALVVAGNGWHTGVIGIVASRLVDKYHRPTVLIATADGQAQGSGRSIPGFHLFEALVACGSHLTNFGGHAMAAGLRLEEQAVPAFREAFLAHAASALTPDALLPRLTVDAEVSLADLAVETVGTLERMGPFGAGNPRPVLAMREVRLVGDARRMGRRGDHMQMRVTEAGRAIRCVGWRMGEVAETLSRAGSCGIAFTARISDFRGPREVEIHLKDLWVGRYGDTETASKLS